MLQRLTEGPAAFTSLVGRAKDQRVSRISSMQVSSPSLIKPEEPAAIGGVAIHDRTDQLVPFDDQPFVDAARRIAEDNVLSRPSASAKSPALKTDHNP